MKKLLLKYRHIWVALYPAIYFPWFLYLEEHVTVYTSIHCSLDDAIPFVEYFIVPYLLWFFFVAFGFVFFFLYDREEFYRFCAFSFAGMTTFLIICTLFHNGQDLRVAVDPEKNIFAKMASVLYRADTNTNVFPSLHVYNSIAVMTAVHESRAFRNRKGLRYLIYALGVLICLSTVFLKQHSVLDGLGAVAMALIFYWPAYRGFRKPCRAKAAA